MKINSLFAVIIVIFLSGKGKCDDNGDFMVGVGIADVTGPIAGIGMMGYANPSQVANGLHTRLFSRAFIFGDPNNAGERVVYVSVDLGMMDQAIKTKVVEELQALHGSTLYNHKNVLLSGTHTHSGPAGYIQYLLYGITSLGFNHGNFNAIVGGIVQSIQLAHANLQPGRILFDKGDLFNASLNRSPTSHLANPPDELSEYNSNVDTGMYLIRVDDANQTPLGLVNWFGVHPTSMNNTNRLISGDNKGYASMLFESKMNPDARPGKGSFVAAFGSSILGDVSPNIMGPRCINTGLPCEDNSTCCGPLGCFTTNCIAFGPGENMEESTKIIGERQFAKAEELFNSAKEVIQGPVQFRHQYVNMSEFQVEIVNSTGGIENKTLCKPALGYSFAAGTIDGPGMFDFVQGVTTGNPFWDFISGSIFPASDEMTECQAPKPVLLAVGEAHFPYEWVPSVVETQILRIGNLYILGVPGELTTMAGRRLRRKLEEKLRIEGEPDPKVVIAGLSNVYTHYISTIEEYQVQRYEAASTIYGPHTLDAYMKQYDYLLTALLNNTDVGDGPEPPNLLEEQLILVPPIQQDNAPFGMKFGDTLSEPEAVVRPGDLVKVIFAGGHPKNNPMRGGSFFLIERDNGSGGWQLIRTDADWDTKLVWSKPTVISKQNHIEITWQTQTSIPEGFYRVRHFGYYKPSPAERPKSYQGSSRVFQIVNPGSTLKSHPLWNPAPIFSKSITTVKDFWYKMSERLINNTKKFFQHE